MSLAKPQSMEELIQHCLLRLGFPVIEVNVAPEQCEVLVQQALDKWIDAHFDGNIPVYYVYQFSPIDETNNYITLPDEIHGVTRILPIGSLSSVPVSGGGVNTVSDFTFYATLSDFLYNNGTSPGTGSLISFNMSNYNIFQQYMSTVQYNLIPFISFQFNRKTNRIYFNEPIARIKQRSENIVVEGFKKITPEEFPEVWNDEWLKEYCVALIKRQWGENLKKFANLPLPGGATLNGEAIYNEAITEIEKLETRLYKEFQLPPQFIVG